MTTEISINDVTVNFKIADNTAFANTRDIAKVFGKEHFHVIRALKSLSIFDKLLNESKIGGVTYRDAKGEERPMYNLDRDVFSLMIMGFTGEKALEWKLAYIQAFNAMERCIQDKRQAEMSLEVQFLKNTLEQKNRIIADQQKHHLITYANGTKSLRKILKDCPIKGLTEREVWKHLESLGLVTYVPRVTHMKILMDDAYGDQELDSIAWEETKIVAILEDLVKSKSK